MAAEVLEKVMTPGSNDEIVMHFASFLRPQLHMHAEW